MRGEERNRRAWRDIYIFIFLNFEVAGTGISAAKTGKDAARTGKDAAKKQVFVCFCKNTAMDSRGFMKCLKSLPMILKWQGPHEKHEGSSVDFGFWIGGDFLKSMKALLLILDWQGPHEKHEGSSAAFCFWIGKDFVKSMKALC